MNSNIKYILFDLDGTLLPMDMDVFTRSYFKDLIKFSYTKGYDRSIDLVSVIWAGTGAMVKNDGSKTNGEAFWEKYSKETGRDGKKDEPMFDDFYATAFDNAKNYVGYTDESAKTVNMLKEKGYKIILATNPIFPEVATDKRIKWAGLNKDDFMYVTTYENSTFAKPNPKYFSELLNKFDIRPEECLMVGNDAKEDACAIDVGIDFFLITDCLVNSENKDISVYNNGSFKDLRTYMGLE